MRSIKFITSAAALALLAACGGGGGGGGATISGGVVKGPVLGSTVCAFAITAGAKGAQVPLSAAGGAGSITGGCYVTPADGSYVFSVPSGTGDILLEATGGKFCTNETPIVANACPGGGTIVDLGAQVMSAAVAAGANATVYTTPLTTAAVGAAGAGLTAATFNASFTTLAGAVIGAGTTITPASQPTAGTQPYLTTAAQTLAGGGSMASVVSSLGGSSAGAKTPGTINPALAMSYNLVFREGNVGCGTLCSYAEGTSVTVVVNANNTLSVGGKTLTDPYLRDGNVHELIWLDAAAGVEYALSDNAAGGQFNEINLMDPARPGYDGFIGQLRKPEGSASEALEQIAGTYTIASQYAGADVPWTSVTVGADGSVAFSGGAGPTVTTAQVGTITSLIGSQNRIDIMANVDINNVAGVDNDDKIVLFLNAAGGLKDIEYYVGASSSSTSKRGVSLLAEGGSPVSIGSPGEGTWDLPAGNGVNGTVDGTAINLELAAELGFDGNPSTGYLRIRGMELSGQTAQKQWTIQIEAAQLTQGTNYSCIHNTRRTSITVQPTPNFSTEKSSKNGGNCNIYISLLQTSGNTITRIEGRFTAELYGFKRNDQALVTDGSFKYVAP